jgi:hypothetical protein
VFRSRSWNKKHSKSFYRQGIRNESGLNKLVRFSVEQERSPDFFLSKGSLINSFIPTTALLYGITPSLIHLQPSTKMTMASEEMQIDVKDKGKSVETIDKPKDKDSKDSLMFIEKYDC